jgi:Transcriptional regulators
VSPIHPNAVEGAPRSNIVYETIKTKIMMGEIEAHSPLTEEGLAEEYQVSRTPVREALRKLEQDGLVEMIPRKGAYVKGLTLMDIEEIFTVREALEGISAKIATELLSDYNISVIESALTDADRNLDDRNSETVFAKGNEIHNVILKVAGNGRVLSIVSNLQVHIQRLHMLSSSIPGRLKRSSEEHWLILQAIKQRDGELAEKRMREHIRSTKESLILAFKNNFYRA